MRFGLEDGTEWTLASIGKKLNISRERGRQLQNRALLNLRRKNLVGVRDYLAIPRLRVKPRRGKETVQFHLSV